MPSPPTRRVAMGASTSGAGCSRGLNGGPASSNRIWISSGEQPDLDACLAARPAAVRVRRDVRHQLLGRQHAVMNGRRGHVAGEQDPLDPPLRASHVFRCARDRQPPPLGAGAARHDVGRPVLHREHRQVVAGASAGGEPLDGVHQPIRQGAEGVRRRISHDTPEPLQAEGLAGHVERLGDPVRAEDEGVARERSALSTRDRGRSPPARGRVRPPGPAPRSCRRLAAGSAARGRRWRTGPPRSRRRAGRTPP